MRPVVKKRLWSILSVDVLAGGLVGVVVANIAFWYGWDID